MWETARHTLDILITDMAVTVVLVVILVLYVLWLLFRGKLASDRQTDVRHALHAMFHLRLLGDPPPPDEGARRIRRRQLWEPERSLKYRPTELDHGD